MPQIREWELLELKAVLHLASQKAVKETGSLKPLCFQSPGAPH